MPEHEKKEEKKQDSEMFQQYLGMVEKIKVMK